MRHAERQPVLETAVQRSPAACDVTRGYFEQKS